MGETGLWFTHDALENGVYTGGGGKLFFPKWVSGCHERLGNVLWLLPLVLSSFKGSVTGGDRYGWSSIHSASEPPLLIREGCNFISDRRWKACCLVSCDDGNCSEIIPREDPRASSVRINSHLSDATPNLPAAVTHAAIFTQLANHNRRVSLDFSHEI